MTRCEPIPPASRTRLAAIDDDPALLLEIRRLIAQADDIEWIGEFSSAEDALHRLPALRPTVVLMDLQLPGMSGTECTRRLKYALPETQIVILTVQETADALFNSLVAGATGYLLKSRDAHRLVECVREVAAGGSPMSAGIARKAIQLITRQGTPPPDTLPLTAREHMVLELLAKGYLYKEVADELGIEIDTVRNHVRRIYEKLHARNRAEAVLKYGLISRTPTESS